MILEYKSFLCQSLERDFVTFECKGFSLTMEKKKKGWRLSIPILLEDYPNGMFWIAKNAYIQKSLKGPLFLYQEVGVLPSYTAFCAEIKNFVSLYEDFLMKG